MKPQSSTLHSEMDYLPGDAEEAEPASEDDLWFLPDPIEEEPDYLPPGPKADPVETSILAEWTRAEAGLAALEQVRRSLAAVTSALVHQFDAGRDTAAAITRATGSLQRSRAK